MDSCFPKTEKKIFKSLDELAQQVEHWKNSSHIVTATGGRFCDGARAWHYALFEMAKCMDYIPFLQGHPDHCMRQRMWNKRLKDGGPDGLNRLVVLVNSTESIHRLGGMTFYEEVYDRGRLYEVAACSMVDAAFEFNGDTPEHEVSIIKPHAWIKGVGKKGANQDYTAEQLKKLEGKVLAEYGGYVGVIETGIDYSTLKHHDNIKKKSSLFDEGEK